MAGIFVAGVSFVLVENDAGAKPHRIDYSARVENGRIIHLRYAHRDAVGGFDIQTAADSQRKVGPGAAAIEAAAAAGEPQ